MSFINYWVSKPQLEPKCFDQSYLIQSCKDVNVEPTGTFRDFFVKYKTALKEHVPYKYRDIWKILDKKAAQKPYQGNIFTNTDEIKVITILGFYKWKKITDWICCATLCSAVVWLKAAFSHKKKALLPFSSNPVNWFFYCLYQSSSRCKK